jgi:hypothetical protein
MAPLKIAFMTRTGESFSQGGGSKSPQGQSKLRRWRILHRQRSERKLQPEFILDFSSFAFLSRAVKMNF